MTHVTNKIKKHTNYGVIIKQINIYHNKEAHSFLTTLVKVCDIILLAIMVESR